MVPFLTTSELILGRVRDVFWTSIVLGRISEKIGMSFGTVRSIDIDFPDDVIFAETIEVLVEALKSLSEKSVLRVSCLKTKVQAFVDDQDATIESIPVSGGNVEVTQTSTHLAA